MRNSNSRKGFQKWIGYVDVKSAPVHFYVQRNSSFNTTKTPIPFDLAVMNEGNAMNLTSGIFTAPRPGIYFFSFTALARLESSLSFAWFDSYLYLNGMIIGSSYVFENNAVYQDSSLTLQSTLNLKKGDNFGWKFYILLIHPRIWLTTFSTTPISRVSCWRRKLGRHFEVWGSTSKIRKMNVDTKILGKGILRGKGR